jgi:hypothetical protein
MAGQLAWFLQTKIWPDRAVFYRDGEPSNLRFLNLKLAEHKAVRIETADGSLKYQMSRDQQRHYGLRRYYGLTIAEYGEKLLAQNGVCAICKKPETAKIGGKVKPLSVDHAHGTGAVRDLLCATCNHMLGHAREDREILLEAVRYLDKHNPPSNVTAIPPRAVG